MQRRISRRDWLRFGGAAVLGAGLYKGFAGSGAGKLRAEDQPVLDVSEMGGVHEPLGKYIYLTPTKLGGSTHAVDLHAMKQLAFISYWNYGDSCPISHHLSAFPADSGDPYKGFEFINSTQGGDNALMYGIPTRIKENGMLGQFGMGNRIYRVAYDGKSRQMELLEDVSETTGIGLGVHTLPYPDAEGFSVADGQKDVAAFFTRARGRDKTSVQMAFRADWIANSPFLGETWLKGGTIRLQRLAPSLELGVYDYFGTKGNKLNYEMAPMAELLVERGQIPGDSPQTLTGLDFALHSPNNRWSMLGLRMCGGCIVVDRRNWVPVCFLFANEQGEDQVPVKQVSSAPDTWEIKLPAVNNPIHESGFNPSRKPAVFTMMNNLRANNMAIFDSSADDPRKWKRTTFVRDPEWKGEFPSPFHVGFSIDGSKMFVSVLKPKPARSDLVVVDTTSWKIIKKFRNVGVDSQTMAFSYDGKFVFQIFSGFQRMECGVFVIRQDTLEPLGYMPNFGGHHDCVIVPSSVDEMKYSRCCCV